MTRTASLAPHPIKPFPDRRTHLDGRTLLVREMQLHDAALRVEYFHGADPSYLRFLGVDPALLPPRDAWLQQYEADYARPRNERQLFGLVLQLDDDPIGFSNIGLLNDEASALVHFHLTVTQLRGKGLGSRLLRLSTSAYFAGFDFDYLYFEPNAFNTPSNRMAQTAGYRFQMTHRTTPGPIHLVDQPMNRWRIERDADG